MSFGLTQYDVEDLVRHSKNCCEPIVVYADVSGRYFDCTVATHASCSFTRRNRSLISAFPIS